MNEAELERLKDELEEADSELRSVKHDYLELESARAELRRTGDAVGLVKLNQGAGELEARLIKADTAAQDAGNRLKLAEVSYYKPLHVKAQQAMETLKAEETALAQSIIDQMNDVLGKLWLLRDKSIEIGLQHEELGRLAKKSGEPSPWHRPMADASLSVQLVSARNQFHDRCNVALSFFADKGLVRER